MSEELSLSERLSAEYAAGLADLTRVAELTAIPAPSADVGSLLKTVRALKQAVDALTGVSGSVLDKTVTLREMLNEGTLVYSPSSGLSTSAPIYTTVDGGGGGGGGYVDPRPILGTPPTPTALDVDGAFRSVILTWALTDYQNHAYVEVWRSVAVDNLGVAVLVGQPTANLYVDGDVTVGQTYYYWVRAVNIEAAVGAYNAVGGTVGALLTVGTTDLGPLVVEAGNLAAGAVTTAKFAAGLTPVEIVGSLPGTGNFEGRLVYLTTDDKMYRYTGSAWTAAIAAVDVSGQITSTQIADDAITTPKLAANAVTADEIAANSIVAGKIATNAVTAGTVAAGAISAAQIAAGQVQATHLAANSIAVGTAAIETGAITNAMIANLAVDSAKIADLSVGTGKIGDLAVTDAKIANATISNAKIVDLSATKITTGTLSADRIAANAITADKIDSRNLTVKDAAGTVIFSAAQNLDYVRVAGATKPKVYRVVSRGGFGSVGAANTPHNGGLLNAETNAVVAGVGRSYMLAVLSRSTGGVASVYDYDVYEAGAAGSGFDAADLAAALNATTSSQIIVLYTYDEPYTLRTTGGLPAAIYANGGTPGVFESSRFQARGAYMLIAYGGQVGTGNALVEQYAGYEAFGADGPDDAWIDITFSVVNGNVVVGGGSSLFEINAANISTYIASAAIGSAQIANAAITNAKIGNLEVDSAKIANLTVGTNKITASAVSSIVSSTTGGVTWNSTTGLTKTTTLSLGTINTDANGDGKVLILFSPQVQNGSLGREAYGYIARGRLNIISYATGSQYIYLRLKRNGTTILSREYTWSGNNDRAMQDPSTVFLDTPGAGVSAAYTYEIYTVATTIGVDDSLCVHYHEIMPMTMILLEFRK